MEGLMLILLIGMVMCMWDLRVLYVMGRIQNKIGKILKEQKIKIGEIELNLSEQQKDFDVLLLMCKYDDETFKVNYNKFLQIKEHRENLEKEYWDMMKSYNRTKRKYKGIKHIETKWNNRLIFCDITNDPKTFWVK
jgi:hypothetical protein